MESLTTTTEVVASLPTTSPRSSRFGLGIGGGRKRSYNQVPMHHDDNNNDYGEEVMMELSSSSSMLADVPTCNTQLEEYDDDFLKTFTIDNDDDDENGVDDTFEMEHGRSRYSDNIGNGVNGRPSLSPLNDNNDRSNDRPPSNYRCPLTLQVMDDPVNDGCGHCFERRAILDWLEYRDVCPISRKPLQEDLLFRNGHLKSRIQQWKEDHPLYQHLDQHYADHQIQEMLSSDHDDSSGRHSNFELMLLPQERQVLNIVKVRAHSRRKREEFNKCLWSLGITVAVFVVGATILSLILFRKELKGPI
ncbi:U-box domain containing protein [Nitzschia inconspicua]|uniref:U-box domain containing protein n=1 Tax=Nitzschia inconspicua TaxID=303405 RepID=A0A9K3Q1V7_9STRA|nr:U-box domain containing protein [Nitzschia inconspicua]